MESDEIPQSESSRARDFIAELGGKNGFVEQKYWDELSEAGRAKFQRAISSLQGELEPAIKALAQSLYSSTGRFVFELLQNAEDCDFYHAKRRNESPYISFHLSKDRLIIECNEDGFKKADLEAICSIGKSSKSATKGYIGEKGIGFKSVFMAAWKVHIQSGPYSFYFKHHPSDGGMGMITPIWQEPTEELPRHMTRMTLHLHTEGDPQAISQRENLFLQLFTLKGDVLLFMNKLEEIRIVVEESGSQISIAFSKSQVDDYRIKILKTVTYDGSHGSNSSSTLYHITKHQVHNLSKNENRTYSEEEDRRKEYSTAEIVLAFPLTPKYEPVIKSQEVFAFLPVQPAGFSFLIQGDFMTNASREHIVTTAARNTGLRDGIPEAFIKAALEFCNHETLQYTWMKFLPVKENMVDADFWFVLVTNIETKVCQTPLIRPESGSPLRLIWRLRNPRPYYVDEEKNLLLRDLTPGVIISHHYGSSSLAILERLGLAGVSWQQFIRMVDQDLKSSDSWIKFRVSDGSLQTRVAKMLRHYYTVTKTRTIRSMIEELPIIPLQDGRWLAATSEEKIFFPVTAGLKIPEDLDFSLVESSAAADTAWRELLELLGVESLSVRSVRERIFQRQMSYWKSPGKKVEFYVQQLKFLYSTHDRKTDRMDYGKVFLIDDGGIQRKTTSHDVYLPDDDPLGPRELLKPIVCDDSSTKGAPGFKVNFIHDSYLQGVPTPLEKGSLTWRDWLIQVMGVRRTLRLANKGSSPTDLSQVCHYVAKHRPEKFVAFLIHHWPWEKISIIQGKLVQKLKKTKVLCQGGRMLELQRTYIPFPDLQSQCTRFLTGRATFPFLQLELPIERKDFNLDWGFLTSWLGVIDEENLSFYLDILKVFSTVKHPTKDDSHRVFELYSVIHGRCLQSQIEDLEKEFMKLKFNVYGMLLIPSEDGRKSFWATLDDCLWEAPPCLTTSHPLKARMQHFLAEFASLPSFFVDILGVPNCDFSHIMCELQHLSDKESLEVEAITSLYQQLSIMVQNLPAVEQRNIKWAFASRKLIYAEKEGCGGWYPVAECLWASEWDLLRWVILKPIYEDLHDFFVNFLGVKLLSLDLVYNELDYLGSSPDTTRGQIEPNIWLLNSYLSAGSRPLDAKMLLDRKIFPVRYPDGHVQLEKATVEFAIVDRAQLGDIFKPRAKTLDFDLDQVRMLEPTLNWLGLRERYLSEVVRELSRVQGASKVPLSTPERSFKPRAHALYRVAYHYNSPRLDEFGSDVYNSFETAQVYETDGIAATLSLNQDGREICYEKGWSDLHIEVDDTYLEIFVPRDKKSQESCYARKLPLGIFKWLMTPSDGGQVTMNEKALRLIASVLNSSRSVIADILEEEGIAAGEFEDDYEEVEELEEAYDAEETRTTSESRVSEDSHNVEEFHDAEDVASSSDDDPIATPSLATTEAEETPSLAAPDSSQPVAPARQETVDAPSFAPSSIDQGVATRSPVRRQPARPRRFSSSDVAEDVSYLVTRSNFATTRNQPTIQPIPAVPALIDQETTRYQALLERVVNSARGSPRFPSQGAYDMTGMSHALSDLMDDSSSDEVDQFPRFRSSSQQERDRKIGAAGELYVFELLKNLSPGLPGFSLENWRSTIRRYVSPHPDYTNIGHWNHRETSDFEYDDNEGALTELMIDNGYLERDVWGDKKPRYYLEVKTTTGPCEAPFYMSKSQYRLMHQCQDGTDKIYVVFRVYEVEKAAVQLRVYVNPARLKDSGRLLYTAETWSVRPDAGT